jgi:hypothetical protein
MQLTGMILFVFSILGLIVWILKFLMMMASAETYIRRELYGIGPTINILPLIVILVSIAVSAGMAWG